jgi:hypothetical protein
LGNILARIPFANRALFLIIALLWIVDLGGFVTLKLVNEANYSWAPYYQLWRVIVASFCLTSLTLFFFACLNLWTFLPRLVPSYLFRNRKHPASRS